MARIPRKYLIGDDCYFHVTWQCHNRSWLLKNRWAKRMYYQLLLRFKDKYQITFHSYMLMDNHIHLSGCLKDLAQFSAFFRIVNSMFAKGVNQRTRRCGQVVRDRFKSPCLQSEKALLNEMIYHDLNEVRAGKAEHPNHNEMSSYAHYAYGQPDPLITDPEIYLRMGNTPEKRQDNYRAMVLEILIAAPKKMNRFSRRKLFIGDPHWVAKKHAALRNYWLELRKLRRKRIALPNKSPPD